MNRYGLLSRKVLYCLAIVIVYTITVNAAYRCRWADAYNKRYKDCDKFFDTVGLVIEHIDRAHLRCADKPDVCTWRMSTGKICHTVCDSLSGIKEHIAVDHQEELYEKISGQEFVQIGHHRPQIVPAGTKKNSHEIKTTQESELVSVDDARVSCKSIKKEPKIFCTWHDCHEHYSTPAILVLHIIDDHFKTPDQICKLSVLCDKKNNKKEDKRFCGKTYPDYYPQRGVVLKRHIVSHIGLYTCDFMYELDRQTCGMKFVTGDELEAHKKTHRLENLNEEKKEEALEQFKVRQKIKRVPPNDAGTTGRLVSIGDYWYLDAHDKTFQYICLKPTGKNKICGQAFHEALLLQMHLLQHGCADRVMPVTEEEYQLAYCLFSHLELIAQST